MSAPATLRPKAAGDEFVTRIAAAYAAERERLLPAERATMAVWRDLPLAMRLVFVGVYFAGRKSFLRDERS